MCGRSVHHLSALLWPTGRPDRSYAVITVAPEHETGGAVEIIRRVVVFDASDIEAESRFWAGLPGGMVDRDEG